MTSAEATIYHDLERESSDDLMAMDSRRALGRYAEAAYHALQAGRKRSQMGQLRFEAKDYAECAEDWLSAAACFLEAADTERATAVIELLTALDAESKIRPDLAKLSFEIDNRRQALSELERHKQDFLRGLAPVDQKIEIASRETLDYLLAHESQLAGFSLLHYAVFRQATELGEQQLANDHLLWAHTFDPDNANLAALLGYMHLNQSRPDWAVKLGRGFLDEHPNDAAPVRIMLANALASAGNQHSPDQQQAIDILQPVVDGRDGDARERFAALALIAAFEYELGNQRQWTRRLHDLEELNNALQPELRSLSNNLRQLLPDVAEGSLNGSRRLLSVDRRTKLFDAARRLVHYAKAA